MNVLPVPVAMASSRLRLRSAMARSVAVLACLWYGRNRSPALGSSSRRLHATSKSRDSISPSASGVWKSATRRDRLSGLRASLNQICSPLVEYRNGTRIPSKS